MKNIKRSRRSVAAILSIVLCVFALTECINKEEEKEKAIARKISYEQFAGSAKCAGCHKDIFEKHLRTAHYLTSRPASEKSIPGSFEPGKNRYEYTPSLIVAMEKTDSGLYQTKYRNGNKTDRRRFDITIGSGTMGQSYLSWTNNRLTQLPITYFSAAGQWANSPGYPNTAVFGRPITSRCLECHATFIDKISDEKKEPEEFNHAKIIYGVDCEKCHGPAARHAEFQIQNPDDTAGKYIINPGHLSRQQSLDLCALCHGGRLQKKTPSFEFTAGDTLSDYFVLNNLDNATPNYDNIDVHGNQYGLLKASKCFKMSQTLTCITCHNLHTNERDQLVLFSQRCITCHSKGHENVCKMRASLGTVINNNCIDCHMPAKPSMALALFLPGRDVPVAATVRSHFITIYPDETKKFIEAKNKAHKK